MEYAVLTLILIIVTMVLISMLTGKSIKIEITHKVEDTKEEKMSPEELELENKAKFVKGLIGGFNEIMNEGGLIDDDDNAA